MWSSKGPAGTSKSRHRPRREQSGREGKGRNLAHTNSDSTNVSASNGCKSSMASPTPMNLTGRLIVWRTATTTPPLAVPSSLVRITPVQPIDLVKTSAWRIAFWPLVASRTRRTSWGRRGSCAGGRCGSSPARASGGTGCAGGRRCRRSGRRSRGRGRGRRRRGRRWRGRRRGAADEVGAGPARPRCRAGRRRRRGRCRRRPGGCCGPRP